MSLAAIPTDTVKVLDPRIDVAKERIQVITKSGQKVSFIPYKTQSTGGSTLTFNVVPPSRNTFISRKMFIESSVTLTFTTTLNAPLEGAAPFQIVSTNADAPRSFPLSRALSSAQATIGNTTVNMQTADVIDLLLRSMPREDLAEFQDGCPTCQDNAQTYEAYSTTAGLNVLGNYAQSNVKDEFSRGYFNVEVLPATTTDRKTWTQIVTFKVFEPVLLSPFVFSKINHSSFIGLQSMTLTYNFGNKELVWSGTRPLDSTNDNAPLNVNVGVDFAPRGGNGNGVSDANLWVEYISPSSLMEIPKQVSYSYYEVQRFITNGGDALAYGGTTTVNSDNIQLKVVPKLIYMAVRPVQGLKKYYNPDCYFRINKANINFANTVGLLSSASDYNLYQISKKNGLNYEYRQWHGKFGSLNNGSNAGANIPSGSGSILLVNPAEDFGLPDELASGVMGSFNLQVQLQVECINPAQTVASSNYELIIIPINEGQLSIDVAGTGSVVTQVGCVSEADVLKAETRPYVDYNELNGLVGGDWFGKIMSYAKKLPGVVHGAAKVLPQLSDGLKSMGMGVSGSGHGAGVGQGYGGQLVGSAIASKRSLKDRLK